jgi:hypothetical protein
MKGSVYLLWIFFLGLVLAFSAVAGDSVSAGKTDSRALKRNTEPASLSGQRVALVIGNGKYTSSPLKNPVNDADAMTKALKESGFDVIEACDLTLEGMKRAVDTFGKILIEKKGAGLFYYAGHGLQVKGRNYLIPVDAKILNEEDVEYKAMDTGRVLAKMEAARNPMNIVILDACRDNPFTRSYRSSSQGLAHMDAPTGTIIAYATSPGSVAADGAGGNGLYTSELVKFMGVPGLKLEDMFKKVRVNVSRASGNRQTPWESSSLVGDFYFSGSSGAPGAGDALILPASLPVEEPKSLDGYWKMSSKRYFTIHITGDKGVVSDAGFNTKVPGTVILKNIRRKDGVWTADRARIDDSGFIKGWGQARLELNGTLLVEHIDFKGNISNIYEKVK